MPIYEYRCANCGFQDEHLQKVSERSLKVCPSCGKAKYKKMLSAPGFQLKGSGWYATDFKGGAKQQEAKSEAKGDAKADAKDGTKTEAKAETKVETKSKTKTKAEKATASTTTD